MCKLCLTVTTRHVGVELLPLFAPGQQSYHLLMRVRERDDHFGGHGVRARLRGSLEAFEAGRTVERLLNPQPPRTELVPRPKEKGRMSLPGYG